MHAVVMDSLEEYLSGTLEPAVLRDIEAHLSTCELCREEIRGMQDVRISWFLCGPKKFTTPRPASLRE